MRVNGRSIITNPVNPYNAATEKTIAARWPTQLRRKLAKLAASARAWAGKDKAPTIGQWMNGGREQTLPKKQCPASTVGKAPNLT